LEAAVDLQGESSEDNGDHASASPRSTAATHFFEEEEKKTESLDVDLIRRDVGRSVVFRYNHHHDDNNSDEQLPVPDNSKPLTTPPTPSYASERLAHVLEDTIRHGTSLHYYQGLHDVAGVMLHNLDYQAPVTTRILKRVSHSHLRDAMRENFGNITWLLSVLLLPLVEKVEPNVHYCFQEMEVSSNLCLPWIITWFTHDIYDPTTAGRLVDAFLCGHPLLPMYVAVALLVHPLLKQDILTADCEDPASMYILVKQLPKAIVSDNQDTTGGTTRRCVPVQELLDDAISIMYVVLCQTKTNMTPFYPPTHQYRKHLSPILYFFSGNASPLVPCWIWSMPSNILVTTCCTASRRLACSRRHPVGAWRRDGCQ
jgi:hypothetical protein